MLVLGFLWLLAAPRLPLSTLDVNADDSHTGPSNTTATPRVYVINLPSATDRKARMQSMVGSYQSSLVVAVDGRALPKQDLATYTKDAVRKLLPGEVGCFLSHVKAMGQIAAGEDSWGLVLEDDAELTSGWMATLQSAIAQLPKGTPSVLFAGSDGPTKFYDIMGADVKDLLAEPHVDRPFSDCCVLAAGRLNMHAYAVSKSAASLLLQRFSSIRTACDVQMHFASTRAGLQVYAMKSGIATQGSSIIGGSSQTHPTGSPAMIRKSHHVIGASHHDH